MWDGGLGKKSAMQLLQRPEGDHPTSQAGTIKAVQVLGAAAGGGSETSAVL